MTYISYQMYLTKFQSVVYIEFDNVLLIAPAHLSTLFDIFKMVKMEAKTGGHLLSKIYPAWQNEASNALLLNFPHKLAQQRSFMAVTNVDTLITWLLLPGALSMRGGTTGTSGS